MYTNVNYARSLGLTIPSELTHTKMYTVLTIPTRVNVYTMYTNNVNYARSLLYIPSELTHTKMYTNVNCARSINTICY